MPLAVPDEIGDVLGGEFVGDGLMHCSLLSDESWFLTAIRMR
jgi:hypothetical protein